MISKIITIILINTNKYLINLVYNQGWGMVAE